MVVIPEFDRHMLATEGLDQPEQLLLGGGGTGPFQRCCHRSPTTTGEHRPVTLIDRWRTGTAHGGQLLE